MTTDDRTAPSKLPASEAVLHQEWGLVLDDAGSTDIYDTRAQAEAHVTGDEQLVRIITVPADTVVTIRPADTPDPLHGALTAQRDHWRAEQAHWTTKHWSGHDRAYLAREIADVLDAVLAGNEGTTKTAR